MNKKGFQPNYILNYQIKVNSCVLKPCHSFKGIVLPLVLSVSLLIFLSFSTIFYLLGEETGGITKSIIKYKAAAVSNSAYNFLLAKAFAESWESRFYQKPICFSDEINNTEWQKELNSSMSATLQNDKNFSSNFSYSGKIFTFPSKDEKIIAIYILVNDKKNGRNIISCRYYNYYRRNLIDALREPPAFVTTDMTDESGKSISPGDLLKIDNCGSIEGNPILEKDSKFIINSNVPNDSDNISILKEYVKKRPVFPPPPVTTAALQLCAECGKQIEKKDEKKHYIRHMANYMTIANEIGAFVKTDDYYENIKEDLTRKAEEFYKSSYSELRNKSLAQIKEEIKNKKSMIWTLSGNSAQIQKGKMKLDDTAIKNAENLKKVLNEEGSFSTRKDLER